MFMIFWLNKLNILSLGNEIIELMADLLCKFIEQKTISIYDYVKQNSEFLRSPKNPRFC